MKCLRGLVIISFFLPGTARRSTLLQRISFLLCNVDSHDYAQQEGLAEARDTGFWPAVRALVKPSTRGAVIAGGPQHGPRLRKLYGWVGRPGVAPPFRAGPRRDTVALNANIGPEEVRTTNKPLSPSWSESAKQKMLAAVLSCVLAISTPYGSLAAGDGADAKAAAGSPVAREVIGLVQKYYLDRTFNGMDLDKQLRRLDERGPLGEKQALEVSTKLVRGLGDRFSRVLPPTQAEKLGKYDVTGVGINLVIADDGKVQVGAVPPADSDASQLGVAFGDVVLSINGHSAKGMTSFDALEAIQGDAEIVTLRLKPAAGGAERDVSLRKAFQTKNPVSFKLVKADDKTGTGYIKLSEFNAQCKRRVREAIAKLEGMGARRLVLDLRGNGGGVLDGALGIAGLFLERPLVLFVTDANGAMQPLYSRETPLARTLPLEVWVDQSTASSGEVLAAALRDNCRANLVGTTTYGKGVIQGVFGLSDGGAIIETVASYSTPRGDEINKKGITPDEKRLFMTDVLGSSFLDADIKSAAFTKRTCNPDFAAVPTSGTLASQVP